MKKKLLTGLFAVLILWSVSAESSSQKINSITFLNLNHLEPEYLTEWFGWSEGDLLPEDELDRYLDEGIQRLLSSDLLMGAEYFYIPAAEDSIDVFITVEEFYMKISEIGAGTVIAFRYLLGQNSLIGFALDNERFQGIAAGTEQKNLSLLFSGGHIYLDERHGVGCGMDFQFITPEFRVLFPLQFMSLEGLDSILVEIQPRFVFDRSLLRESRGWGYNFEGGCRYRRPLETQSVDVEGDLFWRPLDWFETGWLNNLLYRTSAALEEDRAGNTERGFVCGPDSSETLVYAGSLELRFLDVLAFSLGPVPLEFSGVIFADWAFDPRQVPDFTAEADLYLGAGICLNIMMVPIRFEAGINPISRDFQFYFSMGSYK